MLLGPNIGHGKARLKGVIWVEDDFIETINVGFSTNLTHESFVIGAHGGAAAFKFGHEFASNYRLGNKSLTFN